MRLSWDLYLISSALTLSVALPVVSWAEEHGSFQGKVLYYDRSPSSSLIIKAYNTSFPGPAGTTKTDEAGHFSLPNLPKGLYTIAVFPPDTTESAKPLQKIENIDLAPSAVRAVNFTLDRMGYFLVRLVKSNAPLTGEVYLDGETYGKDTLSKPLLTTAGMHKLTAKSDNCTKSEEKMHNIRPYGYESVAFAPNKPSAQEITLKCLE